MWPRLSVLEWTHLLIIVSTSWNFVCEHGMPYALEINSNGRFNGDYVEPWPSTTKSIMSPLPKCLWPTNLTEWWHTMKSYQNYMSLWSRGLARLHDKLNMTIRVAMVTKLCRMITYLDRLLSIKSHECFILWFFEIMWQTKTLAFLLPAYLWSQNLAGW